MDAYLFNITLIMLFIHMKCVGAFYMKTQMPFELKIGKFSKKCLLIEFSRSQQISKIKAIRRILIELDVEKETVNRAMCSLIL